MTSDPIKAGDLEFQIAVTPLRGGGFTYSVIEISRAGTDVSEKRHDSGLHFETEDQARDGGAADARRRVAKLGR
ncbi:hypothetical protein AWB70_01021 [Caballeronia cordobensis]|uniref:Uncharacterized protein n=1 Tax=Caballeronia cordobensis TaxID=1353886 RepID=A0A158FK36_CABCO|nr:hypothetical protein [Caballeronia cordobensis]SAL20232.1 hypothetical protein AWB70_01021 [Caballeronia cordobensis]